MNLSNISIPDLWPMLLGIFVPWAVKTLKRIFTAPDAQEKLWDDHKKYHDEHTKEHGKVDGRIDKAHSRIDAVEAENSKLRERLARVEAVKDAA